MSEKKTIEAMTAALESWTESQGTKPRQWAKIPVTVLHTFCHDIREAHKEEVERLGGLLAEAVPFMESELAILRRACKKAAGAGPVVVNALNGTNKLESVLARTKRALEA